MSTPAISVVMPSLDQRPFLEEAVRSVLDQPVESELIVRDPGSVDGSRDLLRRLHDEYGPRLRLCFEPDSGQSDAVNLGLAAARAPILGWLNSDDRLRPGALRRVVAAMADKPGPLWLYGSAGMIDAGGRPCSAWVSAYKRWRGRRFSRARLVTENFISQMAVFFNRALWESAGGLEPELHLDMDYDLWFRFARIAPPTVLPDTLADFRVHAAAKGSRSTSAQLDAAYRTARRHAAELGPRGSFALLLHRLYGARTRLAYRVLKPQR